LLRPDQTARATLPIDTVLDSLDSSPSQWISVPSSTAPTRATATVIANGSLQKRRRPPSSSTVLSSLNLILSRSSAVPRATRTALNILTIRSLCSRPEAGRRRKNILRSIIYLPITPTNSRRPSSSNSSSSSSSHSSNRRRAPHIRRSHRIRLQARTQAGQRLLLCSRLIHSITMLGLLPVLPCRRHHRLHTARAQHPPALPLGRQGAILSHRHTSSPR
jgi:hypothetical protein